MGGHVRKGGSGEETQRLRRGSFSRGKAVLLKQPDNRQLGSKC